MTNWYQQTNAGWIQVRLRQDAEWRKYTYRLEEETIYWIQAHREHPWHKIHEVDWPEWLAPLLKKSDIKMDRLENQQSEQISGGNGVGSD